MSVQTSKNPLEFWDDMYKGRTDPTTGVPSKVLAQFVQGRTPGVSLDLGCARGDDVVWLATQGWEATGVDIAPTALEHACANAFRAGVAESTRFLQHDLATDFPDGTFDLVSATFLQTPLNFPRVAVLQRAADAVRVDGLLLITAHGRVAPWSWGDPDAILPDGPQRFAELQLNTQDWTEIFVGSIERQANGPDGQIATVSDAVVALERR